MNTTAKTNTEALAGQPAPLDAHALEQALQTVNGQVGTALQLMLMGGPDCHNGAVYILEAAAARLEHEIVPTVMQGAAEPPPKLAAVEDSGAPSSGQPDLDERDLRNTFNDVCGMLTAALGTLEDPARPATAGYIIECARSLIETEVEHREALTKAIRPENIGN